MTSWGLEARQNSSASGNTGDKGGPGSLIKEVLLRPPQRLLQVQSVHNKKLCHDIELSVRGHMAVVQRDQ